eukprot:2157756-Prymnesium_polylepis.1
MPRGVPRGCRVGRARAAAHARLRSTRRWWRTQRERRRPTRGDAPRAPAAVGARVLDGGFVRARVEVRK